MFLTNYLTLRQPKYLDITSLAKMGCNAPHIYNFIGSMIKYETDEIPFSVCETGVDECDGEGINSKPRTRVLEINNL